MESLKPSQQDEMFQMLKELKAENEILRKEILGVGASASSDQQSMGIMESKTMREIVEETQFHVKALNQKMLFNEQRKRSATTLDFESKRKPPVVEEHSQSAEDSSDESSDSDELAKEYPIVDIRDKTLEEERTGMKEIVNQITKQKRITNGESLRGTTAEAISASTDLSKNGASCTLKLSNFLDYALTDPQYWIVNGSKTRGPSRVLGKLSEVVSVVGDEGLCQFLCSFAISRELRLAVQCFVHSLGNIVLGIGFAPASLRTDYELWYKLEHMPPVPDVRASHQRISSLVPLEFFVNHGNLFVRGHMTLGPKSVVNVEICEMNDLLGSARAQAQLQSKKQIVNGRTFKPELLVTSLGPKSRFSCHVEIVNGLSVAIRNRSPAYFSCENNYFMAFDVLPFQREKFIAADKRNLEAMFSHEVDSTDLAFVVALKVEPRLNSFAAAFVQLPTDNGASELEKLMDQNQWKSHLYRKCATAKEGLQLIQMRNIRAEIRMTEGEKSRLKIRIFAV